jgi:DNA-binding MarR family transcriptional regulator
MERFKTFTVLIADISRRIRKIKTEEMAKWSLKSHHVSCLCYLYEYKQLTAAQLCDICLEDKSNISRSIDFLEENGYIAYLSENKRKYKSLFVLTEKGNDVASQLKKRIELVLEEVGKGLTSENRKIMYESLDLINNNLQKITNEY